MGRTPKTPPAPPVSSGESAGAAKAAASARHARLVQEHMPFVRSIARKLRDHLPGVDFEDLVGFGVQGLIEAAQRYDERHGAVFSTFAYYRVRGAMLDGVRSMGWLPRGEYARMRFEERANAYLENQAAREYTQGQTPQGLASQGAQGAGPRLEEDVRELSTALRGVAAVFVTLLSRGEEEGLADDRPMADDELERHQLCQRVRSALHKLPDKERTLINHYYFEDQTLEQVGERMGLSKSWASRLHARAVALLREALEEEEPGG